MGGFLFGFGMAVAVASNISSFYISERTPAKNHGRSVTFYQLAVTIGVLVACISNLFLQRYAAAHVNSGDVTGLC